MLQEAQSFPGVVLACCLNVTVLCFMLAWVVNVSNKGLQCNPDQRREYPVLYANRTVMYTHGGLPIHGNVLELGVWTGLNALDMYEALSPKLLVLVDSWVDTNDSRFKATNQNKVAQRFEGKRVHIIKGTEVDVIRHYGPSFFSCVYIDTSHKYEDTLSQLLKLEDRVKDDGFICGHDFGHPVTKQYGVVGAVVDFMVSRKWFLTHVTVDGPNRSFCMTRKRIKNVIGVDM